MPVTPVPPGGSSDAERAKLEVWKQMLYEKVKESARDNDLFTQDDLLRLEVIPNRDVALLITVVQSLSNDKLFITMRENSGAVFWKWRDQAEAHKYKQCATDEQAMVYSLIDDSGGDGIWSQTLQRRLNMHDSVLKNAIKQLLAKNLIAPFKNVQHPNKKMYIKASIQPSDQATGGPWYTDQNLDEAFIEEVQRVIFDYIKRQSSYYSTHGGSRRQDPKKGVLKGQAPEKGKKRDASEMDQAASKPVKAPPPSTTRTTSLLPLPAGYTNYPTVRDLARMLSASGITGNTILSEQDVKKLLDVLVWDNLIECVNIGGRSGYRVIRAAKQSADIWSGQKTPSGRDGGPEPYTSAYTEAPCGRCPVFDLCEEGGPVGPSNCVYFQKWLGLEKHEVG